MKRLIYILIASVLALELCSCMMTARGNSDKELMTDLAELYTNIIELDYESIEYSKESQEMIVYGRQGDILANLPISKRVSDDLKYAYCYADDIRFVLVATVDDEYGVVFTKDRTVNMDGVYTLERGGSCKGGQYFYYTTYYK